MTRSALPRFAVAGLLVAAFAAADAQTAPKAAKAAASAPPAKPAAEGKTLSLGGGTGSGKLLTRDELRTCLANQDTLAKRRADVEAARGPLDKEKEDLVKEQEALKGEREKVDAARQAVAELNARYKEHADKVQKWNERAKAAQEASGKAAEKERDALDRERVDLQRNQAALEADRAKLGDGAQQAVNAFNTRAQALDQKVADWNQRNAALSELAQAVNRDRDTWTADCADRRYREDDEAAIRKGQ